MMRKMLSLGGLGLLIASCAPSARAATRDFPVPAFDRIVNTTPLDVHVSTGKAPGVHATAPQSVLDRLVIGVSSGELSIAQRRGAWPNWDVHGRMVIDVTVPGLQAARVKGPGDMVIDRVNAPRFVAAVDGPGGLAIGALRARSVEATVNGPGDLKVAGTAESGTLSVHGPGGFHGEALTLRDATVVASGPGDIAATVTGTARGSLSGPGNVTIHGGARCDITKSGPGDVSCH